MALTESPSNIYGASWGADDQIIFGIAFTPEMLDLLWLDTFPEAEVTRILDAGHYLQEDAYEVIVPALLTSSGADAHTAAPPSRPVLVRGTPAPRRH